MKLKPLLLAAFIAINLQLQAEEIHHVNLSDKEAFLIRTDASCDIQKIAQYPKATQISIVSDTSNDSLIPLPTTKQSLGSRPQHFGSNTTSDLWLIKTWVCTMFICVLMTTRRLLKR